MYNQQIRETDLKIQCKGMNKDDFTGPLEGQ